MSIIEPILRRLPPKVVIPALIALVMLLGGNAVANWRGSTAAVAASVARADERLDKLESRDAVHGQAEFDMLRRLDSIERKLDRALSRRDREQGDTK